MLENGREVSFQSRSGDLQRKFVKAANNYCILTLVKQNLHLIIYQVFQLEGRPMGDLLLMQIIYFRQDCHLRIWLNSPSFPAVITIIITTSGCLKKEVYVNNTSCLVLV